MRKSFLLVLGVLLTTGLLTAQDHQNTTEKKAKGTVTFASDTKVGQELLRAGNYRVACDRETITFTPAAGESWGDQGSAKGPERKFPCKGKELAAASTHTEARVVSKDGVQTLNTIVLKGSTIEHTFD